MSDSPRETVQLSMVERICGKDRIWVWNGKGWSDGWWWGWRWWQMMWHGWWFLWERHKSVEWGWRSDWGSWFQRWGNEWRKEQFVILRDEETAGWRRVMIVAERVEWWGWTEIRSLEVWRLGSGENFISDGGELIFKSFLDFKPVKRSENRGGVWEFKSFDDGTCKSSQYFEDVLVASLLDCSRVSCSSRVQSERGRLLINVNMQFCGSAGLADQ